MAAEPTAERFTWLNAADAADVEAIAAQIVPSGPTPGAREARVVYFIDRALSTFFSGWAPGFRRGLEGLQSTFHASHPSVASFAAATPEEQLAFLGSADYSPFFESMRVLTVLGLLTSPKYGGNYAGAGWKLIGFADEHVFQPPFGYYDREYAGFVPYTTKKQP
jgi:hypothetical protein